MFDSLLSRLGSLWGGSLGVTFESLLGHSTSFCISVKLGLCPLVIAGNVMCVPFSVPLCQ